MLHSKRTWVVFPAASAEDLAHKLVQYTWTCCSCFELDGYLFANDATSGDGAQEYAVLKPSRSGSDLAQIESITFSWCTEVRALGLILRVLSGDFDWASYGSVTRDRFQTADEHRSCPLCA